MICRTDHSENMIALSKNSANHRAYSNKSVNLVLLSWEASREDIAIGNN
jgi:hypothetical protein